MQQNKNKTDKKHASNHTNEQTQPQHLAPVFYESADLVNPTSRSGCSVDKFFEEILFFNVHFQLASLKKKKNNYNNDGRVMHYGF